MIGRAVSLSAVCGGHWRRSTDSGSRAVQAVQAQEDAEGFKEKPRQATRFFREGRAGQWKDALSSAQV